MADGPAGTHRDILFNARRQAEARGLDDVFIVDADSHHYELDSWAEIVEYIPDRVLRNYGRNPRPGRPSLLPAALGSTDIAGRLMRGGGGAPGVAAPAGGAHPDAVATERYMDAMGVDTALLFPTPMQFLGLHPMPEVEEGLAWAYNRWLVERILPAGRRLRPLLYLPFNVPDACAPIIEAFAGHDGVAGFMVASARYRPVHDNRYMRAYAVLEETGLPLAFHAAHDWHEMSMSQANRYLGVYALSLPHFNMLHLVNWLVNGLPERFPGLRTMWMEAGIAWIPYLMQRLDSAYLMRTSEAPALRRRPSEYMREMYFSTHPIDDGAHPEALEFAFRMIGGETRLLWASGYPQWNFDLPSAIWDLPFLGEAAKRAVLGGNAARLFALD